MELTWKGESCILCFLHFIPFINNNFFLNYYCIWLNKKVWKSVEKFLCVPTCILPYLEMINQFNCNDIHFMGFFLCVCGEVGWGGGMSGYFFILCSSKPDLKYYKILLNFQIILRLLSVKRGCFGLRKKYMHTKELFHIKTCFLLIK